MTNDYELLYRNDQNLFGETSTLIRTFFENLDESYSSVLDVGCGQGRNAIYISKLGYDVTGIDISKTGIAQINQRCIEENIQIETIISDAINFVPSRKYDIIIFERTLHMLGKVEAIKTLQKLIKYVEDKGAILISDEPKNIKKFFTEIKCANGWSVTEQTKNHLIAKLTI